MRRMHHLLSPEIPDVDSHFVIAAEWARPIADFDALRGFLSRIKPASRERFDQRSFAYSASAHKNQLRFVQRLGSFALGKVVTKDFFGGSLLREWAKDLLRNCELPIPLQL